MKFRGGRDWRLRQFGRRGPVIDRRGTFNEGGNVIDRYDPPRGLHRLVAGKDPVDGQAFAYEAT